MIHELKHYTHKKTAKTRVTANQRVAVLMIRGFYLSVIIATVILAGPAIVAQAISR